MKGVVAPPPLKGASSTLKIKSGILIEAHMFYSDAFRGLNRSAIIILMRCLQKRKWEKRRDPGSSYKRTVYLNDGFVFPYSEAAFLGIGTTQFWRAMRTLVERGFVDVLHQGGWFRKSIEKDLSVYRLSDRWKRFGTPEFQHVEKRQTLSPEYFIGKNLTKKSLSQTSKNGSKC